MTDDAVRKGLEKAYEESRAVFRRDTQRLKEATPAIRKGDYDALAAVFRTLENKEYVLPTREQFDAIGPKQMEESIEMLASEELAPADLARTRFIKAETDGNTAVYYMLEDVDSPDHITLSMVRFQKSGATWKRQGPTYSYSFGKKSDEENQAVIEEQLRSNPEFRL